MRLSGKTLAETSQTTGLSAPTIIKAFKAFEQGGWAALQAEKRGRKSGQGAGLTPKQQSMIRDRLLQPSDTGLWSRESLVAEIKTTSGAVVSERAVARMLEQWGLECPQWKVGKPKGVRNLEAIWYRHQYQPLVNWAEATGVTVVRADCQALPEWPGHFGLWFQTPQRKQLFWVTNHWPTEPWLISALTALRQSLGPVAICMRGLDLRRAETLSEWLLTQPDTLRLISVPTGVETKNEFMNRSG